jgi:hypothetical protein
MARRVISEVYYTFTPSTKTIVIPRAINREKIILITDVTNNIVLYNFSDPSIPFASFTNANNTTTIVLGYNTATTAFSTTDKLQILIDEDQAFKPSEEMMDAVGKLRTSSPQALIDTDFEYGLQPTKWEQLSLINYRPSFYYNVANTYTISNLQAVNGSRTITANVSGAITGTIAAGTPVFIQDATFGGATGLYVVDSIVSSGGGANAFLYTARFPYTGTTGSIYDSNNTTVYIGTAFTANGTTIPISTNTIAGANITFSTTYAHGLAVGNEIAITGVTGTNPPNGSWVVQTVDSQNTFTIGVTTGTASGISGGSLYVRPQGLALHRAYDGGVKFSTYAYSHNQQFIRQTRRYFRYQSGKGIQMSTGTVIKPSILPDAITSSAALVTVLCKEPHNLSPGNQVAIAGCNETAYNGTFTVTNVKDPFTFYYTALTTPSATTASGNYTVSVTNWYGARVRVGLFDDQNGIFFEHDGQTLYAVRRTSTYQIAGYVNVTNGQTTVTGMSSSASPNGSTTLFSKQLSPGDFIVIRGMSYRVLTIDSDTSLQISPAYRGTTVAAPQAAVVSRTVETRIAQSAWNIDRCDGTGASGFNLDLTKMQMFYMDYSWYGAGIIRWGFRSVDGNIVYCHKMTNNNVNYIAYMRSGNLPARYEVNTFPPITTTSATVATTDTVVTVSDTSLFPSNGTIIIKRAGAQEAINYTGKSNTTFTGLTRAQAGGAKTVTATAGNNTVTATDTSGIQIGQYVTGTYIPYGAQVVSFINNTSVTLNYAAVGAGGSTTATFYPLAKAAAQTFTFSDTSPTAVELYAPTYSPTISHWGTSVMMDGRYDDDKSFVFTRGMPTAQTVTTGTPTVALMSIRIAPSVSNGIGGSLVGTRELINRMQMILRQLDLSTNGNFLISLVLNGLPSDSTAWVNQGGSSLAQYCLHSSGTTISGGENIYGFFTNSAGGSNFTSTSEALNLVRDLGSSINGGGYSTAVNTGLYPDGPDRVTVVATNLGAASANVFARIAWTEAQA